MADVFRSAHMSLVQIFISGEIARETAGVLGIQGLLQFRDLNESVSGFQRSYVDEIRQVDNIARVLRQLEKILAENNIEQTDPGDEILQDTLLPAAEINDLYQLIIDVDNKISRIASSVVSLKQRRDNLIIKREVLRATDRFFGRENHERPSLEADDARGLLSGHSAEDSFGVTFDEEEFLPESAGIANQHLFLSVPVIAGCIPRTKYSSLERLAWRASRGNVYILNFGIEQAIDGVYCDAFVAYTHSEAVAARIKKIAESMEATLFAVDHDRELRKIELEGANGQLTEVFGVLDISIGSLESELEQVSHSLAVWRATIAKEKAVYETLNRFSFDQRRRCLIGEAWVPTQDISNVQNTLQQVTQAMGVATPSVVHKVQTNLAPPTYHRTNKVTAAFQSIVDVYGIATYQEVNPGLPTVVTFPFMFAIMFGDIGHGLLLSMAALVLVLKERSIEKQRRGEIFDMAFSGRYVLLFMGLFSIYTGLLYNDMFSKAMTLFSSGWRWPEHQEGEPITASFAHTYPIGLDWAWHGAENNLLFVNSYKMKLSILMGFIHMTYSLFFQLVNARYFDSWVDVVGNFIPGMLFMQSIFGYLCITIVYKWSVDWLGKGQQPPGLLTMLINMFLSPGTIEAQLYRGQKFVQIVLLLIALVCVPWLLLFKPMYLRRLDKQARAQGFRSLNHADARNSMSLLEEEAGDEFVIQNVEEHTEFEFGEVMIHQVIHTIEFCLNCVSHTASYLRLWALSLAHNQLSSVLWDMTIRNAFGVTGAFGVVMVFCLFAMWFIFTVLILVCMEGTSAMLHSLRLHWVEAMSKHFDGEGHAYTPFAFKNIQVM